MATGRCESTPPEAPSHPGPRTSRQRDLQRAKVAQWQPKSFFQGTRGEREIEPQAGGDCLFAEQREGRRLGRVVKRDLTGPLDGEEIP